MADDPNTEGGEGGEQPAGGGEQQAEQQEQVAQFDRGKLHPALRDMAPEEITELFETMAGTLRTVQSRGVGPDTSGVPAHAAPPAPPKKEPISKDKYRELMDPNADTYDPETAFRLFAEQNYGQLLGDVNARTIRSLYGTFRTEFDDFKDYEADITTALQGRDSATLSERDILATYLQAKGLRQTLAQRAEKAKRSATTLAPTPAVGDKKKEVELSSLEEEIAHKMFRRIKDPAQRLAEYRKFAARDEEGGMTVQVPVGGGKKE